MKCQAACAACACWTWTPLISFPSANPSIWLISQFTYMCVQRAAKPAISAGLRAGHGTARRPSRCPAVIAKRPVAIAPFREQAIVETLDCAIGHLSAEIQHRIAQLTQWLDRCFALVRWAIVDRRHGEHASAVDFRRKVIRIGNCRELDQTAKPFGSSCHEVAPRRDDRRCVGFRIERRAVHQFRCNRMQPEFE